MAKAKTTTSKLSGTPWHTEFLRMADDDHRRDKRRCRYFGDGYCNHLNRPCGSSTYCRSYKESESEERINREWVHNTRKEIVHDKVLQLNPEVRARTVERGDSITLLSYSDNKTYELHIPIDGSLAALAELSIGKQKFSSIIYNGCSYKLSDIVKRGKPSE